MQLLKKIIVFFQRFLHDNRKTLRGETKQDVLKYLRCYEPLTFAGQTKPKLKLVYYTRKNQMILLPLVPGLLHFFNLVDKAKAFYQTGSLKMSMFPAGVIKSSAEEIIVQNNVIIKYRDVICKIHRSGGKRKKNALYNEATAIKKTKHIENLKTPTILFDNSSSHSLKQPCLYFTRIKNIQKHNKQNMAETAQKFLLSLLSLYDHVGWELYSLSQLFERYNFSYDNLLSYGWTSNDAKVIHKMVFFCKNDHLKMPYSFIHGDASLNNSLRTHNDELIIIDWESSRYDFVAFDIEVLARINEVNM